MTDSFNKVDPLTSFATGNRKGFAGMLLILAVIFGGVGAYGFYHGVPALRGDIAAKPEDPAKPPEDAAKKTEKINGWEYISAGVTCSAAALALLSISLIQLIGLPKTTESEKLTEARTAILFAGGAVGLSLMLLGAALFVCRIEALNDWLSLGKSKQMAPVLIAVAVSLIGAVIAFLAISPARAEERSNPNLRRLVYGTNAALITLVLLGVLVGLNVLISIKMPGKLDTTESGFYTLDPRTKEYLLGLDQKVIAYTTLPTTVDSNEFAVDATLVRAVPDARRLLDECAAVNPAKITVRPLSSVTDQKEINSIAAKYPSIPFKEDIGILLVLGDDEKRASFVSLRDLVKQTGRTSLVFEGEGRLIRELLFLADNKAKSIIYVTQGAGELALAPIPNRRQSDRTMVAIRSKLEQINCEVRPLQIDAKSPRVPADAALVVVADPSSPLSKETISALIAYANPTVPPGTPPEQASKKGKLIILSGAYPAPDMKSLVSSGIEELLQGYGLVLGSEQIYSDPIKGLTPHVALMEADRSSSAAVAKDFSGQPIFLPYARTVSAAPMPQNNVRTEVLFTTKDGRKTFLDGPDPRTVNTTWQDLQSNPALRDAKKLSSEPRPVAVAVKEGEKTQAIVFGSGLMFSDMYMRQLETETPIDLFAALVDTLRDRPAVASLATKSYGMYMPPSEEHFTRMFWLPVLLVPLVIGAAGIGVWVVRRK